MPGYPLFISSGDLVADRRYRWALNFLRCDDLVAAADILEQLVDAVPRFATAWFTLAIIRERMGDRDGAIAAFRAARDADHEDYHGARLHLARLGAMEATPAMMAAYVRRLFDQNAADFEQSLVQRLGYCGPQLLLEAVQSVAGKPLRFASVLDLGCGTGLGGAAVRPYCDWLVGVDIAAKMIERARDKGVYDRLITADLSIYLAPYLAGEARESYDLVLAADVFVYCADVAPLAAAVARALAPGGLFAFTVETHAAPGVRLQETLRYAHGADHVRDAVAAAGLQLKHLASKSVRTEKGVPVPGLLAVAKHPRRLSPLAGSTGGSRS